MMMTTSRLSNDMHVEITVNGSKIREPLNIDKWIREVTILSQKGENDASPRNTKAC
jgi:hypothetical protein